MGQSRATIVESFAIPPARLWAVLSDHEGMSDWIGARVRVIDGPTLEGSQRGGVVTVRRLRVGGLTFDEAVTYADAPRRMVYRIVRGVPLLRFHRGEILIEAWGETGSRLTWDVLVDSRVPGVARAVAAAVARAIRAGLGRLRARLSP